MNKYQREIKFRIWDKRFSGGILTFILNSVIGAGISMLTFHKKDGTETGPFNDVDFGESNRKFLLHGPEQFTGLTDRTGKEIYEGDICESSYDVTGQIIFLRGMYYLWNRKLTWEQFIEEDVETYEECATNLGGDENSQSNLRIVGNIFENPELLKA